MNVPKTTGETEDIGQWLAATLADASPTGEVAVLDWRMKSVSARPPIHEYLAELWERRYFIAADARARAFQTSRGMLLGKVWLVVSPFLNAAVYWVIFGLLLHVSRGIPNFLAYLIVGVNFFAIVQSPLGSGATVIQGSIKIIRAFSFPRVAVVISWLFRSMLDFIPVYLATLLFIAVFTEARPTVLWVMSIPAILLGYLFAFGLTLLTASVTALIPDLKFIWPLLGRFWFYVSGVFFAVSRFDSVPMVKSIMEINPGYVFLTLCRDTLVYNTMPALSMWLYMAGWGLCLTALGFIVFWLREESYGRQ